MSILIICKLIRGIKAHLYIPRLDICVQVLHEESAGERGGMEAVRAGTVIPQPEVRVEGTTVILPHYLDTTLVFRFIGDHMTYVQTCG